MCRFYGFRANEPTKVECTLVYAQNALLIQSRADLGGREHADGWGVGSYHNTVPDVERSVMAAYEDAHFSFTAERVYARTVIAHVRQATMGALSLENTHPFSYGPWLFAHNGTIFGFEGARPYLEEQTDPRFRAARNGDTDSEYVFYWLLTRMAAAGIDLEETAADPKRLVEVMAEALPQLAEWNDQAGGPEEAKLNFLLTDGSNLVASRWNNTLHLVSREGVHDCEICGIPHVHHTTGTDYRAVVVASEPISHEAWQEAPEKSIVSVDPDVRSQVHVI